MCGKVKTFSAPCSRSAFGRSRERAAGADQIVDHENGCPFNLANDSSSPAYHACAPSFLLEEGAANGTSHASLERLAKESRVC